MTIDLVIYIPGVFMLTFIWIGVAWTGLATVLQVIYEVPGYYREWQLARLRSEDLDPVLLWAIFATRPAMDTVRFGRKALLWHCRRADNLAVLVDMMYTPGHKWRIHAVQVLCQHYHSEAAIGVMLDILSNEKKWGVHKFVLITLATLNVRVAVPIILQYLQTSTKDRDYIAMLEALEIYNLPDTVPDIIAVMHNPGTNRSKQNKAISKRAAAVLRSIGTAEAIRAVDAWERKTAR